MAALVIEGNEGPLLVLPDKDIKSLAGLTGHAIEGHKCLDRP